MQNMLERGNIIFVRAHRSYSENEPLQLAKKRYYEKNKAYILIKRKEYSKKQLESENIDEIKSKAKRTPS